MAKKSNVKQDYYEKSDLAKKIGKEKLKESKKRIANKIKENSNKTESVANIMKG